MFRADAAETELHTDASSSGLGDILMQSQKPSEPLHVVYYSSQKLVIRKPGITRVSSNC